MADTGPPGNQDYLMLRESQERNLADRSRDRAVRRVHLIMADRYAALAREHQPPPKAAV